MKMDKSDNDFLVNKSISSPIYLSKLDIIESIGDEN